MSNSRAQHGEDLAIVARFGEMRAGFFVEVGALDGEKYSNTYLLEHDYGWSGILVEANPAQADLCRVKRPASRVADVAVTSPALAGSPLTLQVVDGFEALSTFAMPDSSRDVIERHVAMGEALGISEVVVTTRVLDEVLSDHGCPSEFEFLSLDIEGHEHEALQGLSLGSRWRPTVVLIENNSPYPAWTVSRRLLTAGYEYKYTLGGINDWYEICDSPSSFRSSGREIWSYKGPIARQLAKAILQRTGLLRHARRLRDNRKH